VYEPRVGFSAVLSGTVALGSLLSALGGPSDLRYALYPLQPAGGLDRAATAALEDSLRRDLQESLQATLFSRNDTAAMLRPEGGRLGLSCDSGGLSCLTDLGQLLGAQKVIFGQVAPDRIFLKLVDVESGGEERRIEETGQPVATLLEAAAVHLLAPKSYLGSVAVTAVEGARISVDGAAVGTAPLGPISLSPGQHQVTAAVPGGPDLHATVEVRFKATAQLDLRPPPAQARRGGLSPWGLGLLVGAAGVTVVGVVAGVVSQQNRDALSATPYPVQPSQAPTVAQQLDRAHGFALAADVLFVVAGAAAIAAVVLLVVDRPGATAESSSNQAPVVSGSPGGVAVHF
jgi:hypothetical protein